MPKVRLSKDVDYIIMINYFAVNPKDQQEFAELEVKEIDKYGDNMDSALAASFHRSLEGSRVFNYAHWQSQEALSASQQSEEFEAHIDRMSHLDFTPDPRVYEVVGICSEEQPAIDSNSDLVPVLTMVYVLPGSQQPIVEFLTCDRLLQENVVSSHLLRSRDEERVAIYTQCRDRNTAQSLSISLSDISELIDRIETFTYELLGSYN